MVTIPRLQRTVAITSNDGKPLAVFHQWWQTVAKSIEGAFDQLEQQLIDIQAAQAAADAAQDSAIAAQADATDALADALAAQSTADGAVTDAGVAQATASAALGLATTAVQQDVGAAWTAPTGTASRATFATYAGQTVSNPPTQAEVQAIDDHLVILSQRMKAVIDDLKANGALT